MRELSEGENLRYNLNRNSDNMCYYDIGLFNYRRLEKPIRDWERNIERRKF